MQSFTSLKSQTKAIDDLDPYDNDKALDLSGAGRRELAFLLERMNADTQIKTCGHVMYELLGQTLRIRISDSMCEVAVRKNTEGHWVDVTQSKQGPWFKALRGLVIDAIAEQEAEQNKDKIELANDWQQLVEAKR